MARALPRPISRRAFSLVLPAVLAGCATLRGHREDNPLHDAGFVARAADTPARQAMLLRLPPERFLRHYHGGKVSFVFADPGGCDCLYVGNVRSFRRYWRRRGDPVGRAEDHHDLFWDWNAWGVFAPDFRWGPGMGW